MKLTGAKIPAAGAALAVAFLGGVALAPSFVTSAAAQMSGGSGAASVEHAGRGGDLFKAAADFIGITAQQLRTEMGADKSMADVAVAHGKTRDALISALATAQSQRIAELVDHKGFPQRPEKAERGERREAHVKVDVIQTASTYLGLSVGDLRTQLRSGKSLAQIADATAGKSKDGLIQAIVASETARIDKAVADGKIGADLATKLKAGLSERVTRLVEHSGGGPARGPRGGRP